MKEWDTRRQTWGCCFTTHSPNPLPRGFNPWTTVPYRNQKYQPPMASNFLAPWAFQAHQSDALAQDFKTELGCRAEGLRAERQGSGARGWCRVWARWSPGGRHILWVFAG